MYKVFRNLHFNFSFNSVSSKIRPVFLSTYKQIDAAKENGQTNPLFALLQLRNLQGEAFLARWKSLREEWSNAKAREDAFFDQELGHRWDLSDPQQAATWTRTGNGTATQASPPGSFSVLASGDRIIDNVHEGGIFTHGISCLL